MKLLIWPPVDEQRLAIIREAAGKMAVVNAHDAPSAAKQIIDADAFFGKMTPELLQHAQRLQWIQAPTASLEHYLFPELIDHSARLSNMRGLYSDVIADHVMAYVLSFARNVHVYLRQQCNAEWAPVGGEVARPTFTAGPATSSEIDRRQRHLADCTLGVVGVGSIGSEICRRANAFSMKLVGVDPASRGVDGVLDEVWPTERLVDLLVQSDFVVIAAPHTPDTFKLFRREQFRRMKRSAYLINIGRGAIVDLQELTDALEAGEIAGAGLDVFEIEPLPADHPLWTMENVIITPHVAAASPRIAERHTETLLENIRRFAAGREPLNLVDKTCWY